MLHEYLKVVDLLTINDEHRLKREVETLKDNKSEIQQLKEEFEKLKAATKHHINNQVKESLELEGVKISEALVDILYKSEKANIRRAVAKYARDNNIEVDFGLSELTD